MQTGLLSCRTADDSKMTGPADEYGLETNETCRADAVDRGQNVSLQLLERWRRRRVGRGVMGTMTMTFLDLEAKNWTRVSSFMAALGGRCAAECGESPPIVANDEKG